MKADKHFQKGERFERSQMKLDPVEDSEAVIESCYMAAHNYLLAGAEWRGFTHPQSHAHSENAGLLNREVKAPQEVQDAWVLLDKMRPGHIYGSRSGGTEGAEARKAFKTIKDWAEEARPHP